MVAAEKEKLSGLNSFRSLISGGGAGVFSTVICAPLDVAKVRMQVQGSLGISKYTGTVSAIQLIYREEKLQGLFKGLGPALMTVPLFWSIYFHTYERMKYFLIEEKKASPVAAHMISAVCGGAIGDVVTSPFWVTRTRIQTLALHEIKNNQIPATRHITAIEMMKMIYREEGFFAFYKGLSASLLGLSHVAVQFPLYEHLKLLARNRRPDNKETILDLILASISAKIVASVITYPHEVLRSRIQDRKQAVTLRQAFRDISKEEGVGALWTGIRLNVLKVIPSTLCTFLAYEFISRYIQENFPGA